MICHLEMQTQQEKIIKPSPGDNSNGSLYLLEDTESPMLSGTVAKGDTFKVQQGNLFCITILDLSSLQGYF